MTVKRYGAIVCSKCKRAWGIDLSQKTTKCPQCAKLYNVAQRKIFYRTSNFRELQLAIAKIQEKLIK
jgi:hypothetical protein